MGEGTGPFPRTRSFILAASIGLVLSVIPDAAWPITLSSTASGPIMRTSGFSVRITESPVGALRFGRSKPIDDVTESDIRRYPIWIWALDEEGVKGQDETWTKPVTSHFDVTEELRVSLPMLTLNVVGTDHVALASFHDAAGMVTELILAQWYPRTAPTDLIGDMLIFDNGAIVDPMALDGLAFPLTLEAVASITGDEGVRFEWTSPDAHYALRSN